jgi:hypothetical protein
MVVKGRRGIDCSFAVPPPERVLELGFDFVLRYLSVPPSSPAKNWTRAQIEMYREAGIDVGAVWEMSASRPNLGATYGEIDGRSARLEARKLDWPNDVELITACDLNSFVDNIDRHEMYVRGFHKTNEQEWIGLYGDTDILARTVGVWNIGWVPIGAWAWSGTSRADAIARAKAVGAHVLQSKGYYIDNIWAVDPNDVINDFPLWASKTASPPPPPPPPPPPQGDDTVDIRLLTLTDSDAQFLAETTADGRALNCRWADGSAKTQAVVAAHRSAAAGKQATFEQRGDIAGLANVALIGPLPVGDSKHTWSGEEFAAFTRPAAGVVDQNARDAIAGVSADLAAVDASVDKIKAALVAAGT